MESQPAGTTDLVCHLHGLAFQPVEIPQLWVLEDFQAFGLKMTGRALVILGEDGNPLTFDKAQKKSPEQKPWGSVFVIFTEPLARWRSPIHVDGGY